MIEKNSNAAKLIEGANQQRYYGTASGVAGLVGGVIAGIAAPVAGVAIGFVGLATAAALLFNAEGKEKQARLEQQKNQ